MNGDMLKSLSTVLSLINTGGVVAVLLTMLVLFYRGDILPRKVYEQLTRHILTELCDRIIDKIDSLLNKQDDPRKDQHEEAKG